MSFGEAVRACLAKYIDFSGRARRSEFWWFALFQLLVSVTSAVLDWLLGSPYVGAVTGLALLLPGAAVTVRRLHDTDRSAYWLLAAVLVMVAAGIAGFSGEQGLAVVLLLIALAIDALIVVWTLMQGAEGTNRFGPAPA